MANERLKVNCDLSSKQHEQALRKNIHLLAQIADSHNKTASTKESMDKEAYAFEAANREKLLLVELLQAKENEEQRLLQLNETYRLKSEANQVLQVFGKSDPIKF